MNHICLKAQRHHHRERPQATSGDRTQRQDRLSCRQHDVRCCLSL
jgi:hypothetical protein